MKIYKVEYQICKYKQNLFDCLHNDDIYQKIQESKNYQNSLMYLVIPVILIYLLLFHIYLQ